MPRPTAGQTGQKRQRSKKAMPKKAADVAVRAVSDMPDAAFVRLTCNYLRLPPFSPHNISVVHAFLRLVIVPQRVRRRPP